MDPRNRNTTECNILQEELLALKELIRLQRERIIIIKAADKGAWIVIVNFQDYMSSLPNDNINEAPEMYYTAVNEFALEEAKTKIISVLKEALENNIITKEEYAEMNPEDKNPAKLYCNYKEHKKKIHDNIPPVRPIISGSGAITENISVYFLFFFYPLQIY